MVPTPDAAWTTPSSAWLQTGSSSVTAIAIGIVCRYPYRCCCHHRCHSSRRRLRCLRHRCPDVSIAPDAPAAPPLPPSFVTDPTAVRLRLATVPRQRRRWRRQRQRRRRSAADATAPTPDTAWTTPSSVWRTGSSSARSSRQRRCGAEAAESGDRDDIDACDRHQRIVHWAGGSEGNDGSGIATEDDDNTDVEAGGYAHDFSEVVLRRLWEGRFGRRRTTTKMTETSRDDKHEEDVVTRSMFKTLCEGKLSSSLSTACPKCRSSGTTAARAGGADPSRTKRSRTV
jgi:hypothetical protein